MRTLILIITLSVMAWVGCSPIERVDTFKSLDQRLLLRRSSNAEDVKGKQTAHHDHQATTKSRLEVNLRKGEYACGGRACRLRPGEVPRGCNGLCQHSIS